MVGSNPDSAGRSTRSTTPVHTRLHGSAAGIRKTISIRLFGSIHSPARKSTPAEPMSSVYPMSHRPEPTRRNSTGIFRANRNSTGVRMPWERHAVHTTKVLFLGNEAMIDGEQGQFKTIGNADLIKDVSQMVFHGLLADGEFLCNFAIRKAGDDRTHNIQLPRGQAEFLF